METRFLFSYEIKIDVYALLDHMSSADRHLRGSIWSSNDKKVILLCRYSLWNFIVCFPGK